MVDAQHAGVTLAIARYIAEARWDAVPASVSHEAKRALLNWSGCAVGGCRDKSVDTALAALGEFAGPPQAVLFGRGERVDILTAAALNALSSNILDFDDTHLRTVIHPSVPVAAALIALAERSPISGAQLLHAFILGVEIECRVGNAISPEHYDAGWHITSTCGVFGAAAACAKVLGLDTQKTAWALGIAANQAAGTSGAHGSMTKSWNMASAARNGLMAALLAARGFTSTERGLEGARGFAEVFARRSDLAEMSRGLGESWEITQNAYKPYPCGIVAHPIIDACLALRGEAGLAIDLIERIDLQVHPLVRMLMGNAEPATGLQAKLSVQHCAAAAFILARVGVQEFTDDCVNDPLVAKFRARVALVEDASMPKEATVVTVVQGNGALFRKHVPHATGSLQRPMSDRALEEKFLSLADWGGAEFDTSAFIRLAWSLEQAPQARAFSRATVPPASGTSSRTDY